MSAEKEVTRRPLGDDILPGAREKGPIRWWPALLVTVLFLAGLAGMRLLDLEGQTVTTARLALSCLWLVCLLLWASFLARFSAMIITSIWLGLILAILVFVSLFRFRGVSGDLVPLFEPRWRDVVQEAREAEDGN